MSLSRDEIEKVAKLSKLRLTEEEFVKFDKELNDILDYINVLNELDTENVKPLVYIHDDVNNFREDEARQSIEVSKAMLNAPVSEDNTIVVPKVIGE